MYYHHKSYKILKTKLKHLIEKRELDLMDSSLEN